jgi:hypothetical protein
MSHLAIRLDRPLPPLIPAAANQPRQPPSRRDYVIKQVSNNRTYEYARRNHLQINRMWLLINRKGNKFYTHGKMIAERSKDYAYPIFPYGHTSRYSLTGDFKSKVVKEDCDALELRGIRLSRGT